MVKPTGRRADVFAVIERMASSCQQRTTGVGQGGSHLRIVVAKTVGNPQVEHPVHKLTVVGTLKVGAADRFKTEHIGVLDQAAGQPVLHHQSRFAGGGGERAGIAGGLFGSVKHFHGLSSFVDGAARWLTANAQAMTSSPAKRLSAWSSSRWPASGRMGRKLASGMGPSWALTT